MPRLKKEARNVNDMAQDLSDLGGIREDVSPKDLSDLGGIKESEPSLEATASPWQRFRAGPIGRTIFGPTELEKQAGGPRDQVGVLEIPEKALQFTTLGLPPVKKAAEAVTEPVLGALPPGAAGVGRGIREFALGFPLAPLPGVGTAKALMGASKAAPVVAKALPAAVLATFGAEYLSSLPDVYQKFKEAVAKGDTAAATQIATEAGLGGALLAYGTKHAITKGTPDAKTIRRDQEVVPQAGQVPEGGQANRGGNVQQIPSGSPDVAARPGTPPDTGVNAVVPVPNLPIAPLAKRIAETMSPEETQVLAPPGFLPPQKPAPKLSEAQRARLMKRVEQAKMEGVLREPEKPPEGAFFQGVRGGNLGSEQGKSGWLTDSLDLAKSYAHRPGEPVPGRIDVYDPKDLPPKEQIREGQEGKTNIYSYTALERIRPVGQMVQEGGRWVYKPNEPPIVGMGGATPSELTRAQQAWGSTALDTANAITNIRTGDPSVAAKVSRSVGESVQAGRGAAQRLTSGVVATASKFKQYLWDPPKPTNFTRWLGKWSAAKQQNDFGINKLGDNLEKAVPDRNRQEAIYNWAAADGDPATLARWAKDAPEDVKLGYVEALTLTPEEKQVANQMRIAYDEWFDRAVENGMLQKGVEDYLKRVVIKRPEISDELIANFGTGRFSTNFREAKKRVFDVMVDAEKRGIRYDKRIRTQSLYAQSFESAALNRLAARQFFEADTEEGKPFAIVEGRGIPLEEGEASKALLVTPYGARNIRGLGPIAEQVLKENPGMSEERAMSVARERLLKEYVEVPAPGLRNWQWVYHDPASGRDAFVKGNALVHKSIAPQVKNLFVEKRIPWLDPILRKQAYVKGSALNLSLFHNVHEAVNAVGHLMNPGKLRPLEEYLKTPAIQQGMEAGLKLVGNAREQAYFAEGSGASGWPEQIPVAGEFVQLFKHLTFEDWIPRLKAEAYLRVFERNKAGGLTGLRLTKKLTDEQNAMLSAKQVEATFGERNYTFMASDPRFRQAMQALFLAPDFQSSKIHHIAQAATRFGGEQRMAIGAVGAGLYISARILNKLLDDDYHWNYPFSVVVGNRKYTLRSLPGDLYHLITDPRSYAYYRLSPVLSSAMEALWKKDYMGRPVDWSTVAKDIVLRAVPIPLVHRKGLSWSDQLASAMGMSPSRYSVQNDIYSEARKWLKKQGGPEKPEGSYPESKYIGLRYALEDNNIETAKDEYRKLVKEGTKPEGFRASLDPEKAFTGSKKKEAKFVKSLDDRYKKLYQRARQQKRETWNRFLQIQKEVLAEPEMHVLRNQKPQTVSSPNFFQQ